MATLAERVLAALRGHKPFTYCCTCLAAELGLLDVTVRDTVRHLVAQDSCQIIRRFCDNCRRMASVLAITGPPMLP
jgi:hypothetical protein